MGYHNDLYKFGVFSAVMLNLTCDANGMVFEIENRKGQDVQVTFSDSKSDSSVTKKQIAELASDSVANIESMKKLVTLLCRSDVDVELAHIAHVIFARSFDPLSTDVDHYTKCIRMIADINFYKSVGKKMLSSFFLSKYYSGEYEPASFGPLESPEDYM